MLKKIAIAIVVLVLAVLVFAATKPSTFRVERTATIHAPPEKIAPFISDFHQWSAWSPYERLDPQMKRTYSGAESGKGAVYAWEGNAKAGAGRMEVIDVSPSKVLIDLEFIKPMAGRDTAEFTMVPQGDSTTVTWAMYGPNSYVGKVMSIFFSMDKMIGGDFATGLQSLKAVAEK